MTTRRGRVIVAVAAVVGLATVAGCSGTETISGPGGPSAVDLDDVRLVSYDSCAQLLEWFHQEAGARVGPYGLEGVDGPVYARSGAAEDAASSTAGPGASTSGSAAPQAAATTGGSSTTNTQEPGVGEPDLVWTDGSRLVTVVNQRLQVVDLDTASVTADLDLSPDSASAWPTGLLVDGDHALVLQRAARAHATDGAPASDPARGATAESMPTYEEPVTVLTRVDLDGTPEVVGTVTVEGDLVDARMVDGIVRTVVRTSPADLGFVYPSGRGRPALDRAIAANREVVAESTLDDWLPSTTVAAAGGEPSTTSAVDCAAVDHPKAFGGFGVVTVVGLDLGSGAVEPLPSAAVVADAETVYSSSDALYVATTRYPGGDGALGYDPAGTTATTTPYEDQTLRTEVHAFSLPADAAARYEASGAVPGTLVDQFALSEHDGDLRVATTVPPGAWSVPPTPARADDGTGSGAPAPAVVEPTTSESRVTVLRPDGDRLSPIGEVTGLGPTEQIRGVRFAGPTAYVVTFRQTDPLYVVDLADPTAPRVAGELKIPGYSSYLQVLGDGRVLGIGQDATDTGRATGLQESLFDVSEPSTPARLAQLVVPYADSTAESDHHALLWWPDTDLLAVPVTSYGPSAADGSSRAGVLVTRVTDAGITEVGVISHPGSDGRPGPSPCPPNANCIAPATPEHHSYPTPIERTLVAGGRLVTVSTAGVKVSDLATLADVSWTAL